MSERMRYWQARVAEFESSGLSRAAFCRRRRLNYHTMTYWLKRLKQASGESASFVEVSLPTQAEPSLEWSQPTTYEVLLGNGRSIRLAADFDAATLARIIQAVESC